MAALDDALKLLGFSTPVIYAGATYGLFRWLDANASEEAKAVLASMLKTAQQDKAKVASAFVEVFDNLYTQPLLHWRAFVRSGSISIVIALFYTLESADFHAVRSSVGDTTRNARIFWTAAFISLVVNIISDYVSLFVIRPWLIRSGRRPIVSLLTASVIGAIIIFFAVIARMVLILLLSPDAPADAVSWLLDVDSGWGLLSDLGIYYPLFLVIPGAIVFAWLPLLACGIVVIRATTKLSWAVEKMEWFLKDGKEHPLEAVGYVAAAIVFVPAAVWQLFFKAASA